MNHLVYFSFCMSKHLVQVVTLIYENVCLYICKGIMNKQIFYLNRNIYFFKFKSHYILIHIMIAIKPSPSGWRNPIHWIFVLITVRTCPISEDPMSSGSGFNRVACASVKIINKNNPGKKLALTSSYPFALQGVLSLQFLNKYISFNSSIQLVRMGDAHFITAMTFRKIKWEI